MIGFDFMLEGLGSPPLIPSEPSARSTKFEANCWRAGHGRARRGLASHPISGRGRSGRVGGTAKRPRFCLAGSLPSTSVLERPTRHKRSLRPKAAPAVAPQADMANAIKRAARDPRSAPRPPRVRLRSPRHHPCRQFTSQPTPPEPLGTRAARPWSGRPRSRMLQARLRFLGLQASLVVRARAGNRASGANRRVNRPSSLPVCCLPKTARQQS
jgi:hypothetical protein